MVGEGPGTQRYCPGAKGVLAQCGAAPRGGEVARALEPGGTELDRTHRTCFRLSSITEGGWTPADLVLDTLWLPWFSARGFLSAS